jgi:hypothetical protein
MFYNIFLLILYLFYNINFLINKFNIKFLQSGVSTIKIAFWVVWRSCIVHGLCTATSNYNFKFEPYL